MRFAELVSAATVAASVTTVLAENAPRITNNPPGGVAFATLKNAGGRIEGVVAVSTGANGVGADFVINLNGGGPPYSGGPFMFHVHEKALSSSGDCASAGAHLDPTLRGESPGCDATKPETCQVGDLSGKFGNCETMPGCSKTFRDDFTSLTPGNAAYIGDKSFVVHLANKTRIACANFVYGPGGGPVNGTATTTAAPGSASGAAANSSASAVSTSAFGSASSVAASASRSAASASASAVSSSSADGVVSVSVVTSVLGFALSFAGFTLW